MSTRIRPRRRIRTSMLRGADRPVSGTGGSVPPPSPTPDGDDDHPFRPVQTLEMELSSFSPITAGGSNRAGEPFASAQVLVRLHGAPLGSIRVELGTEGSLGADHLRRRIEDELGAVIADHLRADGLSAIGDLLPEQAPPCRADIISAAHGGPLASVVIPTMGRPDQITNCVDSVLASTYPRFEVLVVDNGPADKRTRAVIDERYGIDRRVRYLAEPIIGASVARNRGLGQARGSIVAFTDDDVIVDAGWLGALVAALVNQPEAACATGLVVAAELETREQVWFESIGGFERGYQPVTYRRAMQPPPTLLFPYTPGSLGASNNMAVRADAALALGGFDTRLGPGTATFGGEDLDLFTRFLLGGSAVTYEPRALAHHCHRRDPAKLKQQVFTYGVGATAMLTKWAVTSPELRARLPRVAAQALSLAVAPLRRTGLGRLLAHPMPTTADEAGPVAVEAGWEAPGAPESLPLRLVATQLAGYLAGPYLWARSVTSHRHRPAIPWPATPGPVGSRQLTPGALLPAHHQEDLSAVAASRRSPRRQDHPGFRPVRVLEVELTEPLPTLSPATATTGETYGTARVLVRVHGTPIGSLVIDLSRGEVTPLEFEDQILAELSEPIGEHLAADGRPGVSDGLSGLADDDGLGVPACSVDLTFSGEPPLVSVVVATCRRPDFLEPCVDAILANDYPNFELLVVDNSPEDPRTRTLIDQRYGGDHRVRYFREWLPGLSHARNTGLGFSRGEIVAFTDDDVLVDAQWLRPLVAALVNEPDAACATGLVIGAQLDTQEQVWFEHFGGFNKGYQRRVFDLSDNQDASPLYPYNVGVFGTGANMALRKSRLDDLFGFDTNLGAGSLACGGEDLDCFVELLNQGRKLVYDPRSLVWHRHRRTGEELRRMMRAYGVGLSAFLTKQLVSSATRADLVRKIPAGVRHVRRDGRQGNLQRADYPRDLVVQELIGMASGPFKYVHSRLHNAWRTA